eukprot:scaffold351_cov371-Prasinococcus_capsulatus_cf.AAC.7
MGCTVDFIPDVGVAGLHRILSQLDRVREADVVIVAAGMDGALPSVCAGRGSRAWANGVGQWQDQGE